MFSHRFWIVQFFYEYFLIIKITSSIQNQFKSNQIIINYSYEFSDYIYIVWITIELFLSICILSYDTTKREVIVTILTIWGDKHDSLAKNMMTKHFVISNLSYVVIQCNVEFQKASKVNQITFRWRQFI